MGNGLSEKAKAMLKDALRPSEEPAQPKAEVVKPTPEQMRGGRFARETGKVKRGQVDAAPYRRQPLFETLFKTRGTCITDEGLRALRFYRDRYEATAASLTRCALDVRLGGGGSSCLPPLLDADYIIRQCDTAMGAYAPTMRAVALEDQSFSDVAIARFGSRTQNWLEMEKQRGRTKKGAKMVFVDKIVPKSGRHREIIKEEFAAGLELLIKAVRRYTTNDIAA